MVRTILQMPSIALGERNARIVPRSDAEAKGDLCCKESPSEEHPSFAPEPYLDGLAHKLNEELHALPWEEASAGWRYGELPLPESTVLWREKHATIER